MVGRSHDESGSACRMDSCSLAGCWHHGGWPTGVQQPLVATFRQLFLQLQQLPCRLLATALLPYQLQGAAHMHVWPCLDHLEHMAVLRGKATQLHAKVSAAATRHSSCGIAG